MVNVWSNKGILLCWTVLLCVALSLPDQVFSQTPARDGAAAPDALRLDDGYIDIDTPDFRIKLVKSSQTIAAMEPKAAGEGFDFTPSDRLNARAANRYNHLGDLTLRVRQGGGEWTAYRSSADRKPVEALSVSGAVLAAADMTATMGQDCPLNVVRQWVLDDGKLVLRFKLTNQSNETVEIGALGIPVVFNNIITRRSLEEAHEICSFADPYIGQDAGYLQVCRLSGHGPALVVVPHGRTPFEAYHLLNEPTRPNQTFEGTFEWMVHTKAYAENEWQGVEQWNVPTSAVLAPGQTKEFGIKFLIADKIRQIEETLSANGRPVAVGIPGTILPMDIDGKLFLKYGSEVSSVKVSPAGAVELSKNGTNSAGWQDYDVKGKHWGRARVTLTYADGLEQTVNYYVIKEATQAVADMGNFLTTRQWYVNDDDPFGRSPSIMSYDREEDRIVEQDSRVWISGLGDEGGSGSWLAAAMKQYVQPNREEVIKFETFLNKVLWGKLQVNSGDTMYGVRKSVMYYEPDEITDYYRDDLNWGSWTSWNKRGAADLGRAYNYPHVVAAHWTMYRLARNHTGLVTRRPWQWYLVNAYETSMAVVEFAPYYTRWGLMNGTVFIRVLEDLKREGWDDLAANLEALMKRRADRWNRLEYPFGSEMAWDSTGQEEVYGWCKYFNYDDKAAVSLNSILAYMPVVPHWGYSGNARRYWDFLYAGKIRRIERQIHHYGSGLNAIPVISEYRENPDDYYLLRAGYAGTMGALSNIDREGFASAAFHSFPSTLKWDPYTGDYGPNFFGHAMNSGVYIINHPDFGWQAFGGNVTVEGGKVTVAVLDAMRRAVYVAPFGLWMTLDAGTFQAVEIDDAGKSVKLVLSEADAYTPHAFLRIEQPAKVDGIGRFRPTEEYRIQREAWVVPLDEAVTVVRLTTE